MMIPHVPWHFPKLLDKCHCPLQAWFLWFCTFPNFFLVVSPMSHQPSIHHLIPSILCWSSLNIPSLFVCDSPLPTLWASCDMLIAVHTSVAVPWSFIHLLSITMLKLHWALVLGAGHCSMWVLSSISVWHWGHFAVDCWPLLTMFFPCAKWPVMCFEIHLHCPGVLFLIAHSIAMVSIPSGVGLLLAFFPSNIAVLPGHSWQLW